jgi:hypothetical protein
VHDIHVSRYFIDAYGFVYPSASIMQKRPVYVRSFGSRNVSLWLQQTENKKFWEELIAYFPSSNMSIIENNSFIFPCVFVAAVMFLPSRWLSTTGVYSYRHRLMGRIYELCLWDGLRCHDMHTKFHKDWLKNSKVDKRDTQTHRQHCDPTSQF